MEPSDDLGARTLADLELVMACQEAFRVEIPDGDAQKVRTFRTKQEVTDYIHKLRKGGN